MVFDGSLDLPSVSTIPTCAYHDNIYIYIYIYIYYVNYLKYHYLVLLIYQQHIFVALVCHYVVLLVSDNPMVLPMGIHYASYHLPLELFSLKLFTLVCRYLVLFTLGLLL